MSTFVTLKSVYEKAAIMGKEMSEKVSKVPTLRFPEFEGEWKNHPLTDFLEFKNGMNPDPKRFGRGTKFISVMDILSNRFICYDNIRASVETNENDFEIFGVNYGDILFQRSSETLDDVGRANVYLDKKQAIFGGFVIRGKKIGDYNPLFFRYLLSCSYARKRIIVNGAGSQHFNIGQDGLSKVFLNFPSVSEQDKIAEVLNTIDERISTQSKIIEKIESLIKGLNYKIYNSLSSYECKKLKEYCSFYSGGTPVTTNREYYNGQIAFIRSGEISGNSTELFISEEGLANSSAKLISKGDLLLALYGATSGAIAMSQMNGAINQAILCIRTSLNKVFFKILWESQKENILRTYLQGGQGNLSADIVRNITFPIPPIEKQENIARLYSLLDDKLKLEKSFLMKYTKQKLSLLQSVFI